MNMTFQDQIGKFAMAYVDDLVVFSKTAEQHLMDLRKVYARMREAGLRFKIEKCNLFQTELPFLGVIVSQ